MRKLLSRLSWLCVLCCGITLAADAVEPTTVTIVSTRGDSQQALSSIEYYRGTTLLFTNCVMYSGSTTNTSRQGLDTVTIELRIGSVTANTAYSGTAQVASNGTWWASTTVPTNLSSAYVQLKITDVATNSYIYPWKVLLTRAPLE